MNATLIKRVGLLTLGGILGGVGGYFLGKFLVHKYELYIQDKEIWRHFDNMDILEKMKEDQVAGITEDTQDLPKPQPGKAIHGKREPRVRNYTDYSKKEKGDLDVLVAPYVSNSKIGIISLKENTEDLQFNKELITFYEGDMTFCTDEDEIIDDPNGLFGANIHLHFGEGSDDPDVVYVRNEKTGTDYEITRNRGKYSVFVLGMPEEDPKPSKSNRKRHNRKADSKNDDDIDDEDPEEEE
jgi:hypothetical protein